MEFANSISSSHSLITFHNVFSVSTWTPPSHASIFTGKYLHQHDILVHRDTVPPLRAPGLAHELEKHGYQTLAIVGNPATIPFIGKGFKYVIEVDVGRREAILKPIPIKVLRSYCDPPNKLVKVVRMVVRNAYKLYKDIITLGKNTMAIG